MKKIKLLMFGLLSVLTLGLFVVTGKVSASSTTYSLTGTEMINGLGLSSSSKVMDGTQLKSFFTFTGGKAQSASSSKTYTNPEGVEFTNTYSSSAKPTNDTPITITLAITSAMGNGTAYVYAYASGGTPSITVGSADTATVVSNGSVYIGAVNSSNNTIVVTKSGCLHAIYVVFNDVEDDTDNYSVSYDLNGGTGTYQSATYAVADYTSFTLPSNAPTKTGYTFVGWSDGDDNNTNNPYAASSTYTFTSSVYSYEFTAQWTAKQYTVTYNANGGNMASTSKNVTYDAKYTLDVPTLQGKIFAGWYFGDDLVDTTGTWNIDSASITLVAHWNDPIAFDATTSFNNNGALNSSSSLVFAKTAGTIQLKSSDQVNSYNGIDYDGSKDYSMKFNKDGTATLTLTNNSTVIFVFARSNSGNKMNIGSDVVTIPSSGIVEKELTADTYNLSRSNGESNLFYIGAQFSTKTKTTDNVSTSFDAQFDAENTADATKLRFIGTINGIAYADIAKIESVTFTFTFNGSNRTCTCTALYKSINNGKDVNGDPVVLYPGNDGTLYVIFQLNNIKKSEYNNKALTNCKLTVTFEDESSAYAYHADIPLPEFNIAA